MSDFLANLVRRGAGLVPESFPTPAVGPSAFAASAGSHAGVAENSLESGAGDGRKRAGERESSRSMTIQRSPAPGGSNPAGLKGPKVAVPMAGCDPPSSDAVGSRVGLQEGASYPGSRPARTVTPRPEEEPREHRIHGPRRPDTFQAIEQDASGSQDDTSRRSEESPPATPVEKQGRGAATGWQPERDEPLTHRSMAFASRSLGSAPPRDSLPVGEEPGRVVPRREPSWDHGSFLVRTSQPPAAPGSETSTTRIQVRIGRIEVRVVRPPAQATPPPAHTPGGFAEYALARRYLDRVWY